MSPRRPASPISPISPISDLAPGALTPADFRRDTASVAVTDDERRKELRLPCARTLMITPLCSGKRQAHAVGLFDCSGHGLGIIADDPMVVGDQFVASLQMRSRVSLVIYTVRHCQRLDRQFKIGAELTSFLGSPNDITSGNILAALLDRSDKRKDGRSGKE